MKKYKINEIFGPTIQGEGEHTGAGVLFLRFSVCNRRCSFCDTNFDPFTLMTKGEIANGLAELNSECCIIVITGGEPLLQLDEDLCKFLTGLGYRLHIETNGSLPLLDIAPYIEHVSMSPKQPANETKIENVDDIKILCPFYFGVIPEAFADKYPSATIRIQPVMDDHYEDHLQQAIKQCQNGNDYRLSVQLHKVIGAQ